MLEANEHARRVERAIQFNIEFMQPALTFMGPKYQGDLAERELLAIALQESALLHKRQIRGPARGYFQFEIIGCQEAIRLDRGRFFGNMTAQGLYKVIENEEMVMVIAARLLLRRYPGPLPTTMEEGWKQYEALWAPGKPHPERWPDNWAAADEARLI